MTEIFVTQRLFPEALERFTRRGFHVVSRSEDGPPSARELHDGVRAAEGVVCFLTDRITPELLDAAPHLRAVSTVSAGVDHIDVAAATERGVAVTHTPGVLTEATADLTFALILATARHVVFGDAQVRAGHLREWTLMQEPLGVDIAGRCLGMLGAGQIGRAVARRASAGFGMRVLYHTRRRLSIRDEREHGLEWAPWPEVVANADFLSLHAPLTDETRHVIDADALRLMKSSAILINTARGALVDENALAQALASGTIAGAGLDVYENEPSVHADLIALPERTVLLGHVGSATEATRRRMSEIAVSGLIDVLDGRRPAHLVNRDVLQRGTWKE